jgi:hypothetical protein
VRLRATKSRMTRCRQALLVAPLVALLAASAPTAASGDVIAESVAVEVSGEARLGSRARSQALDRAFVAAVDQVLGHLITAETRAAREGDVEREILRRARRYVDSFRVIDEREAGGRLLIKAQVRVVQRQLVETLDELAIERYRARAQDAPEFREQGRPKVVVLLAATDGESTSATFGTRGGDGGPAGRRLVAELADRGFEVVEASGESVPVSREVPDGLLLSDEVAADLAARLGAGGAFVVGLEAAPAKPIRATRLHGAESRASLRVVDASGSRLVTRADARGAGYGESQDEALARAAEDAAIRAMGEVAAEVASYWPPPARAADALTVTIRGAASWAPIQSIAERIVGMPGVDGVAPLGFDRGHVVLAVSTNLGVDRIAAAARTADLGGIRIRTQARGARELAIEVQGAPTSRHFD